MTNIQPNSQTLYLYPVNIKESFILDGRRYILTYTDALISDYGKYGMLPPEGKGFYLKLPKADFFAAQKRYNEQKQAFFNAQKAGYLSAGGQQSFSL
jgi:hypothetical protein